MARQILQEPSRTLMEYRLLPRLTTDACSFERVSLQSPLVWTAEGERPITLNVPVLAAAMQAVSGPEMGIALAKSGGVAFLFCSQPVEEQAGMVKQVKRHKAGFVEPRVVNPDMSIAELHALRRELGFSIFPVVDERRRFLGLIGKNDYSPERHKELTVAQRMIPRERLEIGIGDMELREANRLLSEGHQQALPVLAETGELRYLVFRSDIEEHLSNPHQLVDHRRRLVAGAAVNTHDYEIRVPALAEAGVDVLCIDSSDGFTEYQRHVLEWIGHRYPHLPVIGGNVVTADGFDYLVAGGARAVKVGMGSGTICITQEQKGTGRGLATAVIDVVQARDRYLERTGKYIPVIADGGIVNSRDAIIALALGADSVMMGRYFARMDESPCEKVMINNRIMKPYWGEGSARSRQWKKARYNHLNFVEGVEGFVEYAGRLRDNLPETVSKIKAAMSTAGAANLRELHREAILEPVSAMAIREGQVHDIHLPGGEAGYVQTT